MATRRIFNRLNGRMKLSTVTNLVLVVSSLFIPHSRCEGVEDGSPFDPADFLKKFARKGKEAVDKYKSDGFNGLISQDTIEAASKQVNDLFQSSAPAQLGYGFLMGYASGFCIKKISKVIAFTLGGVFVVVQALSYNGYMLVNYDRLKEDIEGVLDLNNDGKIDQEDLQIAFNKLNSVMSYNMPAGGGFSAGMLFGLRA